MDASLRFIGVAATAALWSATANAAPEWAGTNSSTYTAWDQWAVWSMDCLLPDLEESNPPGITGSDACLPVVGLPFIEEEFQGRTRLLNFGTSLTFTIQNVPRKNLRKDVWIEFIFASGLGSMLLDPMIEADVGDGFEPQKVFAFAPLPPENLGQGWVRETIGFTIRPNPVRERFVFAAVGTAGVKLDRIEVWTRCIPSPGAGALALLAGAVLCLGRRR